jgi:hypothetical protein
LGLTIDDGRDELSTIQAAGGRINAAGIVANGTIRLAGFAVAACTESFGIYLSVAGPIEFGLGCSACVLDFKAIDGIAARCRRRQRRASPFSPRRKKNLRSINPLGAFR